MLAFYSYKTKYCEVVDNKLGQNTKKSTFAGLLHRIVLAIKFDSLPYKVFTIA